MRRATLFGVVGLVAIVACLISVTSAGAAAYYEAEVGQLRGLGTDVSSKDSLRIYDRHGRLLYELDQDGAQHSIAVADVPLSVINATLAIEDHDFWVNDGVDFPSIVRAALADLQAGRIHEGASTITQQLLKMEILGSQVTWTRKLKEAILAVGMTTQHVYSKRQILQLYLNAIPYSPTAYGIDAAAQYYFGYRDDPHTGETAAQHLDLAQASLLAGIPQNPSLNDPLLHPRHARQRQAQVLQAMVRYGYVTQAQANAAWNEAGRPGFLHPATGLPDLAPQFVTYVQQLLAQMIFSGQLSTLDRSGLRVYTTLDLSMQQRIVDVIRQHLFGNDTTDFVAPTLIRDDNVTNAAALIANQHTGAIRVYVGGVDRTPGGANDQFDVLSQGYRSPGSSFKPIVYATAFEKGWFPAMTVEDLPVAFWDAGSGKLYKPLDYDATAVIGTVTLRTALDWSLNIPAVQVMQFAGVSAVRRMAERLGITRWRGTWGLSSVLGALDVTPLEMVQAYTVFADYGQFLPLHAISRITDDTGDVLYQYAPPVPQQVLDPRIAFLITSILSDNASRAGDFGGCSPLYLDPYQDAGVASSTQVAHYTFDGAYGSPECGYLRTHRYLSPRAWPTAAKTGTAQNFKNDWTIGYTMDYTGAVWVGNNNDSPMINIDGVSGAAPIWYGAMLSAQELANKPKTAFPVPRGVHLARYCSGGVCTTDWFLDGTSLPQNSGAGPASLPCVALDATGGWHYASQCQIRLVHKELQNAGAPPGEVRAVGAP